jgi:hypothetical protein
MRCQNRLTEQQTRAVVRAERRYRVNPILQNATPTGRDGQLKGQAKMADQCFLHARRFRVIERRQVERFE